MDVQSVRELIKTIENVARRTHDAPNRRLLAKECANLTSLLSHALSPLLFSTGSKADREHVNAEMLTEHFLRVWLGKLRPELEPVIADSDAMRTPVIEQASEHFITTLTLVVVDEHLLDFYDDFVENEVRRICSRLLDACRVVLDSKPQVAKEVPQVYKHGLRLIVTK